MLTDEQIHALMEKNRYEPVNYGVTASIVHEICTRVLIAEAENKRLLERYDGHVRYGIDLARIIESLCAGDEIVEPKTTARHHYNIAVGAKAENETLRARVKVLEDALEWTVDFCDQDEVELNTIQERARKALEPSLSPLPHNQKLSGMAHKPSLSPEDKLG